MGGVGRWGFVLGPLTPGHQWVAVLVLTLYSAFSYITSIWSFDWRKQAFLGNLCLHPLAFPDFWLFQYPVCDICGKINKNTQITHHCVFFFLFQVSLYTSVFTFQSSYVCFIHNAQGLTGKIVLLLFPTSRCPHNAFFFFYVPVRKLMSTNSGIFSFAVYFLQPVSLLFGSCFIHSVSHYFSF